MDNIDEDNIDDFIISNNSEFSRNLLEDGRKDHQDKAASSSSGTVWRK